MPSKEVVVQQKEVVSAWSAFSATKLNDVCTLPEEEFGEAYGMEKFVVDLEHTDDNYFFYKNNGSNILAVAHLDTVMGADARQCHFAVPNAGPIVFSGALDDRLGAYTILELLPKLGITFDWLLTVGEESGQSTAQYFHNPDQVDYNWMIEFDRGGTDVVLYQYDDYDTRQKVKSVGAVVGNGSFSDIYYLEHMGIKGINWGIGYRDYHGPKSHAWLNDTMEMVELFLDFHDLYEDEKLPHTKRTYKKYTSGYDYGGTREFKRGHQRGVYTEYGYGSGAGYYHGTGHYGGDKATDYDSKAWWEEQDRKEREAAAKKEADLVVLNEMLDDLSKDTQFDESVIDKMDEIDAKDYREEIDSDDADYIENPTPEQILRALANN